MPVTHGHGNPVWTREETVLALELYFKLNKTTPDQSHAEVVKLSEFLRAMPVHEIAARQPSFRNPAGVALKIQNLHSLATGRGLKKSKTDRLVWAEFEDKAERVAELAAQIRLINGLLKKGGRDLEPEDDDEELPEGKTATRIHKYRERNRKLRGKVLAKRRNNGSLKCEICGTGALSEEARYDDAIFEVHHNMSPVAAGERKTKISDVSLLCANCHRHLHRMIRVTGKWILVADAAVAIPRE